MQSASAIKCRLAYEFFRVTGVEQEVSGFKPVRFNLRVGRVSALNISKLKLSVARNRIHPHIRNLKLRTELL